MQVGIDASIPKYPRRFSRRVFLSITLITLLSAAAAFGFYFLRQRRQVHGDRTQRGRLLVRQLAGRCDLGILSENTAYLKDPVDSVMQEKDVLFVTVHDDSGKKIYGQQTKPQKKDLVPKPLPVKVLKSRSPTTRPAWRRSETRYDEFVLPVMAVRRDGIQTAFGAEKKSDAQVIGWVRIGLSNAPAKRRLSEILRVSLYLSGGLFLFGLFAAALVTWRLTGPIARLTRSVNQIRMGNLDQRVDITTHDELGQLGDAFNRMSWNLKETMGKLERLNRNLEAEVAKRTKDIRSLSDFVKVLNAPLEIKPLVEAALLSFKKLSRCAAAAVFRRVADTQLELAGQVGASRESFGPTQVEVGQRNVGRAAQSEEPLTITDVPESARLCQVTGKRLVNVAYLPIRFGAKLEGVLVAASTEPIDDTRLDLMTQAAHQLAVAMANSRTYEATQKMARELEKRNIALIEQRDLLQTQKAKLVEANRLKSEFLANTTHELRTPLNAVIGYTGLIVEGVYGEINQDQKDALKGIEESAQNLLDLINQTLDYAKLESGQMAVVISDVNVRKVVEDTVSASQGLTKDRPYRIETTFPETPLIIDSDEGKIRQILTNLISNAVKFTDRGFVKVIAEHGPKGGAILKVTDSGIGIAPKDQRIIFDAFRQLDGSSTRAAGGTGLGLAISLRFAQLLGGKLTVQSTPKKGSTFTVTLPRQPPADPGRVAADRVTDLDDLSVTMGVGPTDVDTPEALEMELKLEPVSTSEKQGHPTSAALKEADGSSAQSHGPPALELEDIGEPSGPPSADKTASESGIQLDNQRLFPKGGWNDPTKSD
jgi:signal transduction histidine kinase